MKKIRNAYWSRKRKIKFWWEDLVAWWKSYRNLPIVTVSFSEVHGIKDKPVFELKGRANLNITGGDIIGSCYENNEGYAMMKFHGVGKSVTDVKLGNVCLNPKQ